MYQCRKYKTTPDQEKKISQFIEDNFHFSSKYKNDYLSSFRRLLFTGEVDNRTCGCKEKFLSFMKESDKSFNLKVRKFLDSYTHRDRKLPDSLKERLYNFITRNFREDAVYNNKVITTFTEEEAEFFNSYVFTVIEPCLEEVVHSIEQEGRRTTQEEIKEKDPLMFIGKLRYIENRLEDLAQELHYLLSEVHKYI